MKLKKKRIRNSAKAKMKSIEKAIKIGMDNLYSNVSYLLQELSSTGVRAKKRCLI